MENGLNQLWRNPATRRYYRVQVAADLLGDLCLLRSWGSLDNARGNSRMEVMAGWDQASKRLKQLSRERMRRGYERVGGGA